jgi:hypothetical protein
MAAREMTRYSPGSYFGSGTLVLSRPGAQRSESQVEAPNMKLNALAARRADAFHDKLPLGDEFLAGVTRLAIARTTPEARDTVLR